jgi:leucyl/phenylalanyl-tRNA---protein transferase
LQEKSRATGILSPNLNEKLRRMIEPDLLLEAYRLGVFPMALDDGEIRWFSPDPRTILPLDAFHVPHGLKRERRSLAIEIRIDTRFDEVIRACAARPDTWINDEIIESYTNLHLVGWAHSVEAWSANELVGGLYGVAIGGAFFGESMFHRVAGASKIALWALVERLHAQRFTLLDTQWLTPHLEQFGAKEISRALYLHLLNAAVDLPRSFAGN